MAMKISAFDPRSFVESLTCIGVGRSTTDICVGIWIYVYKIMPFQDCIIRMSNFESRAHLCKWWDNVDHPRVLTCPSHYLKGSLANSFNCGQETSTF